jgi:hypothetical protein
MKRPARRLRCAKCNILTLAEYLDDDGLCDCCRVQPELELDIEADATELDEAA